MEMLVRLSVTYAKLDEQHVHPGGVFVNAALNFGTNLDQSPLYPPSLKLSNMLVVGAVDEQMKRAGYSCYGAYVDDAHIVLYLLAQPIRETG